MIRNSPFFLALSSSLRREEERHDQISDLVGISVATLGDLMQDEEEWYVGIPLFKLRFLCGIVGINFNTVLEVPAFSESLEQEWCSKIASRFDDLERKLYMSKEFWLILKNNTEILNLYPLQWADDIAKELGYELSDALSILNKKS